MNRDAPPLELAGTFAAYGRPDGRLGVRNRVLILPSVICSHMVAETIADRSDRAVAAPHDHGCGQLGADNQQTEAVLEGVASNPNVAGTVVVGLGCEEVQSGAVASAIETRGLPVREVAIQAAGGTDECVTAGVEAATELAEYADAVTAQRATLSDLTVGLVGDLADSSVDHAHPLVAGLVDRIVSAGGRVVVGGNERFIAHSAETRDRMTGAARRDFEAMCARHADHPARATRIAKDAIEKGFDASTGFLGDQPVREVIRYGEQATLGSGVALVDAPSRLEEATTALAAAGAHIVIHVTADGVPAGHPIVPVMKVSGDAETVAALPEDIDIDATNVTQVELEERLLAVADGDPACAENHGLTEFAITRVGPSM